MESRPGSSGIAAGRLQPPRRACASRRRSTRTTAALRCGSGSSTSSRARRRGSRPRAATRCCSCSPARAACGSGRTATITTLVPETGVYVQPGESYEIVADGEATLEVLAVEVPDPPSGVDVGERRVTLRAERRRGPAGDGEPRVPARRDARGGLPSVTQFVGYIPVGRAPDHFHTYDEVLYILSGEGVLHIGDSHEPVGCGRVHPLLAGARALARELRRASRCRCSACSGPRARRPRRTTRTSSNI